MATARAFDTYIEGLNELLRALNKLPKEANKELKAASKTISERHMVPAWKRAAFKAGPWGSKLAQSIRAKRDRVPAIVIGSTRKAFSGGASATMVRFPSSVGRIRGSIPPGFQRTGWLQAAHPAYIGPALEEWSDAVARTCRDFNRGQ